MTAKSSIGKVGSRKLFFRRVSKGLGILPPKAPSSEPEPEQARSVDGTLPEAASGPEWRAE